MDDFGVLEAFKVSSARSQQRVERNENEPVCNRKLLEKRDQLLVRESVQELSYDDQWAAHQQRFHHVRKAVTGLIVPPKVALQIAEQE